MIRPETIEVIGRLLMESRSYIDDGEWEQALLTLAKAFVWLRLARMADKGEGNEND